MSQMPNPFGMNRSDPWAMSGSVNPAITRFFNAVYAWMCVGLVMTGGVAWYVGLHPEWVMGLGRGVIGLFVVELILVMAIAGAINRISANVATLMFLAYSAINGVVLSSIFLVFTHSTIASAFFIAAGTFGAMSVYGMVTRSDLMGLGRYLMMALIGLVIATFVSFFWHNSAFQVIVNYLGVFVFVGLTAYDTQRLKLIANQTQGNTALANRLAIVGSLTLYLDFVNLFLFILQLMGDRRR